MSETAAPATGLWDFDPTYCEARFGVRHHAVATFHARFAEITGSYDADGGRLAGEVPVGNVELRPALEKVRAILPTSDFLDAERHPVLSFDGLLTPGDDEAATVAGDLTIRGTTRPVLADGTIRGPQRIRRQDGTLLTRLGIDLSTTIDRRDFGMGFNHEIFDGVLNLGWDVTIDVTLQLIAA